MNPNTNLASWTSAAIAIFLSTCLIVQSIPSKKAVLKNELRIPGVRLQPELDKVDLEAYLANKKALALQVQCVVFDGPCDWVGRWVKPRVTSALLGECLLCTEYQKSHMERIMTHIETHFPEEYKLGVQKFLQLSGINIPVEAEQVKNSQNETATATTVTDAKPTIGSNATIIAATTTSTISPLKAKATKKSLN